MLDIYSEKELTEKLQIYIDFGLYLNIHYCSETIDLTHLNLDFLTIKLCSARIENLLVDSEKLKIISDVENEINLTNLYWDYVSSGSLTIDGNIKIKSKKNLNLYKFTIKNNKNFNYKVIEYTNIFRPKIRYNKNMVHIINKFRYLFIQPSYDMDEEFNNLFPNNIIFHGDMINDFEISLDRYKYLYSIKFDNFKDIGINNIQNKLKYITFSDNLDMIRFNENVIKMLEKNNIIIYFGYVPKLNENIIFNGYNLYEDPSILYQKCKEKLETTDETFVVCYYLGDQGTLMKKLGFIEILTDIHDIFKLVCEEYEQIYKTFTWILPRESLLKKLAMQTGDHRYLLTLPDFEKLIYKKSKRPINDMSMYLTDEKEKIDLNNSKFIQVTRYSLSVQGTRFYGDIYQGCGTYYFYENESDTYLSFSTYLIEKTKYRAILKILNLHDKSSISKVQKYYAKLDLNGEQRDYIENPNIDKNTDDKNLLEKFYAIEDDFDNILCEYARQFGYDVVILTNMVGKTQIVEEVLDTRPRDQTFRFLRKKKEIYGKLKEGDNLIVLK